MLLDWLTLFADDEIIVLTADADVADMGGKRTLPTFNSVAITNGGAA